MAGTLRERIAEYGADKRERYEGYRVLLGQAMTAGQAAADAEPARPPAKRRRGAVWVQLADGRSSFARFLREDQVPGWVRGGRKMGNYLMAPRFRDFDKAMAWAAAVCEVLSGGGVDVQTGHSVLTEGSQVNPR